jgi:hypothetical protein
VNKKRIKFVCNYFVDSCNLSANQYKIKDIAKKNDDDDVMMQYFREIWFLSSCFSLATDFESLSLSPLVKSTTL